MGKKVLNVTLFDTTRGKLPYSNVTIKRKKTTNLKLYFHTVLNHYFFWLLSIFCIKYPSPILDCDLKVEKRHMKSYHEKPCIALKHFMKIPL